jgi:acetolactate synthase I/II/III large subunit
VIRVDVPIVGDVGHVLEEVLGLEGARPQGEPRGAGEVVGADQRMAEAVDCLAFRNSEQPRSSRNTRCKRLEALTKGMDRYICTEVGQHQMWAAQFLGFEARTAG